MGMAARSNAWTGWIAFAGLLNGSSWARWVSIILLVVTIIEQLAFVGSAAYPLWALTVLALSIVVLYALVARWGERPADAAY